MSDKFQAVVIGGGPGGYVCAIRLAQLGLKTACIESRGSLGGTCLNVGCIPSKNLLNLSENYHKAQNFSKLGIEVGEVKLNLQKMMQNKDKAVTVLTKGVEFLFKKNKVTYIKGKGVLFSKNDIVVYENNKRTNYKAKNIVIATGSAVVSLPGIEIDEKNIISSTGALSLNEVPNKLAVIGGGSIGLCAIVAAKYIGCEVDIYAKYDHQIEAAHELGAGELNGKYDRVVDCVGNDETLNLSTKTAKPGSWIVILGIPIEGINLPGMRVIMNEIKIFPSIMYSSTDGVKDFTIAAKVLAAQPEIGKKIITHRFNLDEAEDAFAIAGDKNSKSIKVVFDPTLT